MKKGLSILLSILLSLGAFFVLPISASAEMAEPLGASSKGDLASTSLNYSYDPDLAISFAKQHCKADAQNHTATSGESACDKGWLCAEFVAECLRAGGFPKKLSAVAGLSGFGGQILNYGKKVTSSTTGQNVRVKKSSFDGEINKGDPIVILYSKNTGKGNGHVVIYSGETASDGTLKVYAHNSRKQNEILVAGYTGHTAVEIYAVNMNHEPEPDVDVDDYSDVGDDFCAYIEHKDSGLYVTNSDGNVFGTSADGSKKQIWRFKKLSNGAYSIQNKYDNSYLDVYGPFDADNTNVYTWGQYTGAANQQFYIYHKYGTYYFRPAHSKTRMLDMSSTDDHNLSIWGRGVDWKPQEFNINRVDFFGTLPSDLGDEFYANIEHQSSGMYLTNSNANVTGQVKNGSKNQLWKFTKLTNGAYKIQNDFDESYLDVYGSYDEDNTNVYTWSYYTGAKNQQFYIYYKYNAYYIRPLHTTTKMLDLSQEDYNLELWTEGEDWAPQEFNIMLYHKAPLGDSDGDGEVGSIDVTLIQRYCAFIDTGIDENVLLNGDVDGNGLLEIVDATYIQRWLAYIEIPYSIGE